MSDKQQATKLLEYTRATIDVLFEFHGMLNGFVKYDQKISDRYFSAIINALQMQKLSEWLESAEIDMEGLQAMMVEFTGIKTKQAKSSRYYAVIAFKSELAKLISAHESERSNQLSQSAAMLGELIAAGLLDQSEVEAALEYTALAAGINEREIKTRIKHGLSIGIKSSSASESSG